MSNISGIIKSIQDIMRKDVGVDGDAQRISQLVWMFFLKIFDDREEELELLEDDYTSPLPNHLRWRSWAKNPEGMTGDELLDFVNLQLFRGCIVYNQSSGSRGQLIPLGGGQAGRSYIIGGSTDGAGRPNFNSCSCSQSTGIGGP